MYVTPRGVQLPFTFIDLLASLRNLLSIFMPCLEIEVIGAKPFTFDFNSNLTEYTVIDSNLGLNVSNHFKTSPEWQGKESQMHGLSHVRQWMSNTAEGDMK